MPEVPIWGHELQDYINIGTHADPNWINVTNLLSWDFGDDQETYDPKYLDTKKSPSFVTDTSASIDYEKDAYAGNELDAFLMENEDNSNIAVEVCRVRTWQDNAAKMAPFFLTPKQLDKNSAGEPIKLKGTLKSSTDKWTHGRFENGTFTPNVMEETTSTAPDTTQGEEEDEQVEG